MHSDDDIAAFLARQPHVLAALTAVGTIAMDDCWVGAGLIRNAVWDHLHGRPVRLVPDSDVDVVYCAPERTDPAADLAIEGRLLALLPGIPWSVRNQARMHAANGDPPYRDVADAIRCWPETATAIAARLRDGRVELLAPHGCGDLLAMIVRPTPAFSRKMDVFEARQARKNWRARWPLLSYVESDRSSAPASRATP